MPITVREVLELPVVRAGEPAVLAGGAALDGVVRWVHVSELATIGDLLNGGELLLTTGMALTGSLEQSTRYLESVAAAGALGLVVELGASLAEVGGALVAVAARLGLPLVVLHRETLFVEVTEAVHQIIVGEQYEHLWFSHTVWDGESPRFQAQGGLLRDLAAATVSDEHEALTRATAVGLRPGPCYAPVVVRGGTGGLDSSPAVHRRTQRLAVRVGAAAEGVGLSSLTGLWGAREVASVLCLPADGDKATDLLTRFAQALADSRSSPAGDGGEKVGVGRLGPSLTTAGRSLREAAHAAEVATTMRPGAPRLFYRTSELRIRGLLSLLASDSRLQAFVESELRRLLTHDARHEDGLVELLRHYLEADGNKAALARRVHMSRPTLYGRLAMIERILGVDLDDAESRLSLHVALLGYEQHHGIDGPNPPDRGATP
jgi:Purine catabolism regulatory protein-like family/PucR C-terminal helix-turn-helix domain/GGDEF-like domain